MPQRRRIATTLAAVVALVCAAVLAAPASAATWRFETLDGQGGTNGRTTESVGIDNAAVVWNGTPHVWYHDDSASGEDLRHAWWNGTAWFFETLDGRGGTNGRIDADIGEYNAVTVWNNEPHVWYQDGTNGDLRHAWWNGQAWFFETLDGAGGTNGRIDANVGVYNTVTVWNNEPHVWYFDVTNQDLRHAWWNGTAWFFETLDGAGGTNGRIDARVGSNGVAAVWNTTPHVWYYDATNQNLRHAWWNGTAWFFETLDGDGGTNGRTTNFVGEYNAMTVWNNQPHVWYYDGDGGDLRHAWWNGQAWFFETLDGAGGTNGRIDAQVGLNNAVTVWNNQPHVWYRDAEDNDLRHAWWNGQAWFFETLDGAGGTNGRIDADVGEYNAVTVWNNQPHVWYHDSTNRDLRHAWYG